MPYTTALHQFTGGRLAPIGSGVLLRIAADRFVLTAAHVLSRFEGHGDVVLGGPDGTVTITGSARWNAPPADIDASDDPIDVGVIRLAPDSPHPSGAHFLTLSELSPELPTHPQVLVVGFPTKKTKVDHDLRYVRSEPIPYSSLLTSVPEKLQRFVLPNLGAAFDFDREDTLFSDGREGAMVKWYGMSGGGMWSFNTGHSSPLQDGTKLFAIFKEIRGNAYGIGISVRAHLDLIQTAWPDLRAPLALHFGRPISILEHLAPSGR